MTPKIDYELLGLAVGQYKLRGYQYVEAPWVVEDEAVRVTLPEWCPVLKLGQHVGSGLYERWPNDSALVGSAEQALISMGLPAGAYMAVTPCFRYEEHTDLFTQDYFMKLELFVTDSFDKHSGRTIEATVGRVMDDAAEVMAFLGDIRPNTLATAEGFDLTIGGVEVGSYGYRHTDCFQTPGIEGGLNWVYGTGLALPRFSVAKALSAVC